MKTSQPVDLTQSDEVAAAAEVDQPTLKQYFAALNAGDFASVTSLFAPEGMMHPPFESPIVGVDAIAEYLEKEAQGLKLEPERQQIEVLETGQQQIEVRGKVQTSLFKVNVAWLFVLNQQGQIDAVTIKLLASPQELLKFRR